MNALQTTFRETTAAIIKRHGYTNLMEFEYELEKGEVKCLRIWLGRRTKKTLRVLELTEQDKAEISPVLAQMNARQDEAFDAKVDLPTEVKDWIDGLGEAARKRLLDRLIAEAEMRK